jgi:hypothetical protein
VSGGIAKTVIVGLTLAFLGGAVAGCRSDSASNRRVAKLQTENARLHDEAHRLRDRLNNGLTLTPSQWRAVGRFLRVDSSQPDLAIVPAAVTVQNGPHLSVDATIHYYCGTEQPGAVYVRVSRSGKLDIRGTSAATEAESGVPFCIPKRR